MNIIDMIFSSQVYHKTLSRQKLVRLYVVSKPNFYLNLMFFIEMLNYKDPECILSKFSDCDKLTIDLQTYKHITLFSLYSVI